MTKNSLDKLDALVQAAPEPSEPVNDDLAIQEEGDDPNTLVTGLTVGELTELQGLQGKKLDNVALSDKIIRQRQIAILQDKYIPKLYYISKCWIIFVAGVVFVTGVFSLFGLTYLSDAVAIALITTTTATVLGMFVIVAKWLFPPPNDK